MEVRSTDCAVCHRADALAVVDPPHATFPQSCGDCHETTAWRPAIGGLHPEAAFAVTTGAHQGVTCRQCHDRARGASTAGANTICALCHTGAHAQSVADGQHRGVPGYAFDALRPSFCLDCHEDGTAVHHEDVFPIRSGAHGGIACLDCHDEALGPYTAGQNTDCVGCHTGEHARPRVDGQHREVGRYVFNTANPHFCLECHPRGRH